MEYIKVLSVKIKRTYSTHLSFVFLHLSSHLPGLPVRVVTCIQTLCDMIRNSIYRCYGIIATIKEVFHLSNDLRLASQDTENDLIATSFTVCRLS